MALDWLKKHPYYAVEDKSRFVDPPKTSDEAWGEEEIGQSISRSEFTDSSVVHWKKVKRNHKALVDGNIPEDLVQVWDGLPVVLRREEDAPSTGTAAPPLNGQPASGSGTMPASSPPGTTTDSGAPLPRASRDEVRRARQCVLNLSRILPALSTSPPALLLRDRRPPKY